MNVLLIGGGGREHALAWKLAQSPRLTKLFAAPGNPGIAAHADCVALDVADHAAVVSFAKENAVGLVVVGPEAPLVAGLSDDLAAAGVPVFGPSRAAAQLEGSKGFTKDFCARWGVPTAAYHRFEDASAAKAYAREQGAPLVVKADGLAAGKGVTVALTLDDALDAIDACAGGSLVVEACLEGEEVSAFFLCDGETALPFGTAQDHKRVGDGDTGPNTGGMGAYSPAPVMTDAVLTRVMRDIVEPTLKGMRAEGAPFQGVLFAGLMMTADGPQLIEYNVRFGDPETQVLLPRLDSDLLDLLLAATQGRLKGITPQWSDNAALAVVMAARGYPGPVEAGSVIKGVEDAQAEGCLVFQAGTSLRGNTLLAAGGRVLAVAALGPTVEDAQALSYRGVARLDWPEGFCRRDIGWRALARES